jgi:hypothetical protein
MSVRPGESIAMLDGVSFRALTELDRLVAGEFTICGYKFILSLVSEAVSEFAGSQLQGKTTNMMFRVPDRKNRMVRSHLIHIKRQVIAHFRLWGPNWGLPLGCHL